MTAQGTVDPRFAAVREEFARNFAARGEVGASVCVTVDGETVVDLWGGVAAPETQAPWTRDTIGLVWSCTKGATSLCAHILAGRGLIDLDAPVARYWPEFAKSGKDAITVRMLLNHQAGLAALREPIPDDGLCDWDAVVEALAAMEPLWEPGTRHGYHALVFGHLVGEIVRRVTGRSLGTFFREEVAEPLGLDFWVGLPAEHEPRIAPIIAADPPAPDQPVAQFYMVAMTDPTSIPGMVVWNSGGFLQPGAVNTNRVHAAEIPSANGITNARGLAGMYRPLALGGEFDGVRLVREDAIPAMGAVSSAVAKDATMLVPTRWATGFMKGVDNHHLSPGQNDSVILSEEAFGHLGNGGSLGFADPRARLSFGYTMNRLGGGIGLEDRGQALVDAVYRTLGYRRAARGGMWYV
ncbi:MAG TPA: serine hydrolase domain-containing protein [Actinomycetes bacterium]|jgi:CubicO group peptidase (beta-lactamase class C family)|nr:serine hydrolase domain-containing protein [Actinomycetes bacterium]